MLSPPGSSISVRSEWVCMSMNPGARTSPLASILRSASASPSEPIAAISPSSRPTSATYRGEFVPSTTVVLMIRVSKGISCSSCITWTEGRAIVRPRKVRFRVHVGRLTRDAELCKRVGCDEWANHTLEILTRTKGRGRSRVWGLSSAVCLPCRGQGFARARRNSRVREHRSGL